MTSSATADPSSLRTRLWTGGRHTALHAQMEISVGPNRSMKWGVPDDTRDEATGDLIHDDLVIYTALCSILDDCEWGRAESTIIDSFDPLSDLGEVF